MLSIPVPADIDGDQLKAELVEAGFLTSLYVSGEELVLVDLDDDAAAKVAEVVAGHVPVPPPPPALTLADRLALIELEVRGIKERAGAEAAKASPTAKGVALAVAQDVG